MLRPLFAGEGLMMHIANALELHVILPEDVDIIGIEIWLVSSCHQAII